MFLKSKKPLLSTSLVIATFLLSACSAQNPYTGEGKTSKATGGALIGALTGAAIGLVSSSKSDRGKGALIGAASGAALGGGIGYYMDAQEAKLRAKLQSTGVSVSRNGENIILNMPNEVTFGVNQSVLSPKAKDVLNSVVLVVNEYEKTQINVFGFTDSSGAKAYNLALSKKRADAVSGYMISQKVSINRIASVGMGVDNPIASNSTVAGRAQNRRVEIVLTPLSQ